LQPRLFVFQCLWLLLVTITFNIAIHSMLQSWDLGHTPYLILLQSHVYFQPLNSSRWQLVYCSKHTVLFTLHVRAELTCQFCLSWAIWCSWTIYVDAYIVWLSWGMCRLQSLLCDPNPNSPANSEAARMFSENKREYNRKVREVVEQSWTADWCSDVLHRAASHRRPLWSFVTIPKCMCLCNWIVEFSWGPGADVLLYELPCFSILAGPVETVPFRFLPMLDLEYKLFTNAGSGIQAQLF